MLQDRAQYVLDVLGASRLPAPLPAPVQPQFRLPSFRYPEPAP